MRYALILGLVTAPAFAQDADTQDAEAEPPIGGIGRLACSAIIGAENAPYLAQAGDWALGYMAGRLDSGATVAGGETLSPEDTVDVIAGVATRCRETPDAPVVAAVRDFAEQIFGDAAQAGPVSADPPPPGPDIPESAENAVPPRESVAPEPRPDEGGEAATEVDTDADQGESDTADPAADAPESDT